MDRYYHAEQDILWIACSGDLTIMQKDELKSQPHDRVIISPHMPDDLSNLVRASHGYRSLSDLDRTIFEMTCQLGSCQKIPSSWLLDADDDTYHQSLLPLDGWETA